MATGMYGANPDALRTIAGDIARWGDALDGVGFDLSGQIESLEWQGADADAYRAEWGERLRVDFTGLRDTMHELQRRLEDQADEQDQASQPGSSEGCLESTWNGVMDFFGGVFVDGVWGSLVSVWEGILDLPRMAGFDENWQWSWENLGDAWSQLGPFIGYNPEDGTWWNWGLAGDAWWGQIKDFLAWDMWAENWPRALGQVVWNVGSIFIGVGIVKRVDGILAAGRRRGDGDSNTDGNGNADGEGSAGSGSSSPGSGYASGDPLRPGMDPPGRPTPGQSDGGPGQWTEVNRRDGAWRDYQEQITGVENNGGPMVEYSVTTPAGRVDFDGRTTRGNPPTEVYLEAKADGNPAWRPENEGKPWANSSRARDIEANLEQIDEQLAALPPGTRLEWHVENQAHADALRAAVEGTGLDVEIIQTSRA